MTTQRRTQLNERAADCLLGTAETEAAFKWRHNERLFRDSPTSVPGAAYIGLQRGAQLMVLCSDYFAYRFINAWGVASDAITRADALLMLTTLLEATDGQA